MEIRRTTWLAVLLLLTALPAAPAGAADWGGPDAPIGPGVQMVTDGAQCTANFVFVDADGAEYLGYAAHCAGTGSQTDTNGCETDSLGTGTPVEIIGRDGASYAGRLAYSSWSAMQTAGETDGNACNYNDFALVALDASIPRSQVHPSLPFWGGPEGVGDATTVGETVYSYGNSSLRLGITALSPKQGTSLGTTGGGWAHVVYTATPGIPGDSGSGFLDSQGNAIGVLSTLAIAPLAGTNNVSDLGRALTYANAHTAETYTLVRGTTSF